MVRKYSVPFWRFQIGSSAQCKVKHFKRSPIWTDSVHKCVNNTLDTVRNYNNNYCACIEQQLFSEQSAAHSAQITAEWSANNRFDHQTN